MKDIKSKAAASVMQKARGMTGGQFSRSSKHPGLQGKQDGGAILPSVARLPVIGGAMPLTPPPSIGGGGLSTSPGAPSVGGGLPFTSGIPPVAGRGMPSAPPPSVGGGIMRKRGGRT